MRKWFRIVLIVLLLAGLGGLAWGVLRPREPVYQGKPLTYWLEGYHPYPGRWQRALSGQSSTAGISTLTGGPAPPTRLEATLAIEQAGTNAFPVLLRMLRTRDSTFTLAIMGRLQRQPFIKIPYTPSGIQHDQAFRGINTLAHNGANPELVLPTLIESLKDPSNFVRSQAARTLGFFGQEARPAFPALLELWRRESPQSKYVVREMAEDALKKIDPEAAAKAGIK